MGKILFYSIVFFVVVAQATLVMASGAGATGGIILKNNINPRCEAMAEAYVAVADDTQAMYWNPSGLTFLLSDEISTTFSSGLVDDVFGQISYAFTLDKQITLATGLLTYSGGTFELIDENGNLENLNAQTDILLALAGAYRFNYDFTAGVTLEVLYSSLLEQYSAMTVAMTLGGTYKLDFIPNLRIGAAVKHLGLPMNYLDEADPLPLTVQLGVSYTPLQELFPKMKQHELLLALDLSGDVFNSLLYANVGAEYWFAKIIAARIGYKINRAVEGLSLGLGIKYPLINKMPMQLDYSVSLASEFNTTHKLALSMAFPNNPKRMTEKKWLAAKKKKIIKQKKEEKIKAIEAKLPPVTAQIVDVEKKPNKTIITLNVGSRTRGVRKGVMGVLYNQGRALAGKCKIIQVYPTLARAVVIEKSGEIGAKTVVEIVR